MSAAPKLFLPYQAKWIRDNSRLKLMQKARQIGLSWSTAYGLDREASQVTALHDCWCSSRDELQARLFIEDCKAFAKILHIAATDLGVQVIDDKNNSAHVLQFANGKRIHSMSSNPDAQAGKRGTRLLDEFALHPDPRKLWAIAYPGITWGGSMQIVSTHRGNLNFFNQLVMEIKEKGNPKGISLHTVTLQDALDEGFLGKLKNKLPKEDPRQDMDEAEYFDMIRSGCASPEDFLQEFMCVPADDTTAFLTYELITGCHYPAGVDWELPLAQCEEVYLGVDVGRDHDLTVIWALERSGGLLRTRKVLEMQGETFSAQEARLYPLLELPNVRRCCMDSTGLGRQLSERAQERFGWKVEPVTFTQGSKEKMAYPLRAAFEDRTVQIPDSPAITADLRSIKKVQSAGNHARFAADRGKNGHADRFWALALALEASNQNTVAMMPTPFPTRHTAALAARRHREVVA